MFADRELSQKLERAEGLSNAAFVEARARAFPASGACWTEIAGTRCMFDAPGSPVTQTFGLGMWEPVTSGALDAIEAFFRDRGADVFHEVSPLADASALALLNARGYRPFEFTSILVRELNGLNVLKTVCPVRVANEREAAHWSELSARGWAQPQLAEFFRDMAAVSAQRDDYIAFYAEVGGTLAATGSLNIHGDVALLAGASTVPEFRGCGAQQSLLAARLHYAAQHGCTLATMGAMPGGASQRNAERNGFQVAYTRLKWQISPV